MPPIPKGLARVLVADPERDNRALLVGSLSSNGIACMEVADGESAWTRFSAETPDLVLAALRLPGLTSLDLLNRVRDVSSIPFILQVPVGEFSAAVSAIRRGVSDVIPLPCDTNELTSRVQAAIAGNPNAFPHGATPTSFAGRSPAAMRIREQIRALAGLQVSVLFRGEEGSGRDHAALCLAQLDGVRSKDVLRIAPGSRSRQDANKTVFLESIELHSRGEQAYWSERILESERFAPNSPRRILVSTAGDLERLSQRDDFDAKLARLLLRFVVHLPPLRERLDDLVPLTQVLSRRIGLRIGRPNVAISDSALRMLEQQPWPGNVGQLAALVEKLIAFAPDGLITRRIISSTLAESPATVASLRQNELRRQRDELQSILDQTGGNLAEAARRMNMSRGAIIYRAQKFGLLAKRARVGA
jgi:DNA-binding NtrC family response regulator